MTENFNILVNKLNVFKRRYYAFQTVKGITLSLFLILAAYTIFSLVEYLVYLSMDVRRVIFWGFLVFVLLLVVQFVFLPLLKMVRVVKSLDLKSSTRLIQNHFADIEDKLLNVIELAELHPYNVSSDILEASIDQKINELKVFDFKEAVRFRDLRLVALFFSLSFVVSLGIIYRTS